MKALIPSLTLLSLLAACDAQEDSTELRQGEELAAEYDAKADASTDCTDAFELCIAGSDPTDATALLACGDALSVCLGDALPGVGDGEEPEDGDGDDDEGDEGDGDGDGEDDDGAEDDGGEAGEACEAILDGCLADPLAIDPTCFDDFQTCINDEIEAELDGICDELVAECEASGIPGFDCSALCL